MQFFVEFDWFIGIGISFSRHENWNLLVLQLPIISFCLVVPNEFVDYGEDGEERRRL